MAISNLGELNTQVSILAGRMVDGKLNHQDTVMVIDQLTGVVSKIQHVKIENHYEGQGDGTDGEQVLIGRTIWLVAEEQ